eukprot:365240-Chlamydomonas_euryale.AAC.9
MLGKSRGGRCCAARLWGQACFAPHRHTQVRSLAPCGSDSGDVYQMQVCTGVAAEQVATIITAIPGPLVYSCWQQEGPCILGLPFLPNSAAPCWLDSTSTVNFCTPTPSPRACRWFGSMLWHTVGNVVHGWDVQAYG